MDNNNNNEKTQLVLKQLELSYFKGAKKLTANFDPTTTNAYGDNGTFKTTLFDAWSWLLFGKDSQGNSDSKFDLKTLNPDNSIIEKVDHEVQATISYNGRDMKLRRIFREKWEQKNGSPLTAFTGHETVCYFDEIPVPITEYNKRVGQLVDESLFKLITNPMYFNSLPWKDRRNVLVEMAGGVTNDFILEKLGNKADMATLTEMLNEGKTIADIKAKTAAHKATITAQLKQIPTRIDEVKKSTPEAEDFPALDAEIALKNKATEAIDEQLADTSVALKAKYDAIDTKRDAITKLQTQQNNIVFAAQQAEQQRVNDANMARSTKNNELTIAKSNHTFSKQELFRTENDPTIFGRITAKQTAIAAKRAAWTTENNKTYAKKDGCLVCPVFSHECADATAVRKHDENQDLAEITFYTNKQTRLDEINTEGKLLAGELEVLVKSQTEHCKLIQYQIATLAEKTKLVETITTELNAMPEEKVKAPIKETIADWVTLETEIAKIQATIEDVQPIDNSILTEQKKAINAEIDELKKRLKNRETIAEKAARVEVLSQEEKTLAQEVADTEAIEFAILEFSKAQMAEINGRVNARFKYVKFKLFERQINGSEIECCQTLVNGVPFGTGLNNAACINAGIDIINAISEKHHINAPIFIDNRESVNEIIDCPSQIINLIVSKDKTLTIK